ncbi:MAG: antitoxin [Desulfamplus sp.]|nr:antitoxin [Desulfamplus sp.]
MNIAKSYITDESGKIRSVILDYEIYQKIEDILLDDGLLKAMEEIQDEETIDYEDVRELIKQL